MTPEVAHRGAGSPRKAALVRLLVVLVATVVALPVVAFTFVVGAVSGGIGFLTVPLPIVAAAWVGSEAMRPAGRGARAAGAIGPVVAIAAWGASLSPDVGTTASPVLTGLCAGLAAAAVAALALPWSWRVGGALVLVGLGLLAWLTFGGSAQTSSGEARSQGAAGSWSLSVDDRG